MRAIKIAALTVSCIFLFFLVYCGESWRRRFLNRSRRIAEVCFLSMKIPTASVPFVKANKICEFFLFFPLGMKAVKSGVE